MKFTQIFLAGVFVIDVECYRDERGFFLESWHQRKFAAAGLDIDFRQDGHSRSLRNVLRGMHYQNAAAPMGKLVRCTAGWIFDVAVDLRVSSPTFGKWFGIDLSAENQKQLYIPSGLAHGFVTLSDVAEVQYKQTGFYTPSAEGILSWNDPTVGIHWPVDSPILSKRDQNGITLQEYLKAPSFM